MKKIALINGVNLDRLGKREPQIYGSETLPELVSAIKAEAEKLGVEIIDYQSNVEGEIVNKIYELSDAGVEFGIINPAAFTHTSIALRDCIAGASIKFVEVHISNIHKREEFRHTSLTAPVCHAQICGMGREGYFAALRYLASL
ncbi:MAG: type II 3-dehydroquinate dehydratase [Opitutales bacterium]|nr:type II 3-dehydroquinate dehydratase [Opitutales bacterium]